MDYPIAIWAAHRLSCAVSCANPGYTEDELVYQLEVGVVERACNSRVERAYFVGHQNQNLVRSPWKLEDSSCSSQKSRTFGIPHRVISGGGTGY